MVNQFCPIPTNYIKMCACRWLDDTEVEQHRPLEAAWLEHRYDSVFCADAKNFLFFCINLVFFRFFSVIRLAFRWTQLLRDLVRRLCRNIVFANDATQK